MNLRPSIPVAQRRLRRGQTLEVIVTAPAHDGAVKRWKARGARTPKRSVLCVPLGSVRARACAN